MLAVLYIKIRIREVKMTNKFSKVIEFHFFKYWMFSFEGCSLDRVGIKKPTQKTHPKKPKKTHLKTH
jgi:hypothetical protein